MKIMVARRTVSYKPDTQDNWLPNPYWIAAPYELVQLQDDPNVSPVTGPFRFMAKDIAKADQYAREQNWDALGELAVPELIPPP